MKTNMDDGSRWKESVVLGLISIWSITSVQAKREGSHHNRPVFQIISKGMAKHIVLRISTYTTLPLAAATLCSRCHSFARDITVRLRMQPDSGV